MTIRLSQQYVDVAGTYTDGELRVYRQYASVLTQGTAPTGNTFNETVNQSVNLSDSLSSEYVYGVYDDLGLSDAVVGLVPANLQSPMSLTDNATVVVDYVRSVDDMLSFVDAAARVKYGIASDTLTFIDAEFDELILEDRKLAENTLVFTQTVQTLSSIDIEDTLEFTETVNVYNTSKPAFASNHIFFQETLPTTHRHWIEDELAFSDYPTVPIELSITDTLNLTDEARMTGVWDVLVFTQTAVGGKLKALAQALEFEEALVVQGNFVRLVEDTLGIGHALTYMNVMPCTKKAYSPFVGENTIPGATAPPSTTLPISQADPDVSRFLLYTPARGPRSTTVSLRAPEMDNRDRNAYSRVSRETRGGSLVIFADPNWPKVRTMAATIVGLELADVNAYQTFLLSTLGQEIGITDWEGREWAGVITNPNDQVTQDGRDRWTISFTFEGELLEGYSPGSDQASGLNLTQTATCTVV